MSSCEDFGVVRPDSPVADGCPVVLRTKAVISDKGVNATVEWPMRDRNGAAVDLSVCFPGEASLSLSSAGDYSLAVRFLDCTCSATSVETEGAVHDADAGLIRFEIPSAIADYAGIYPFQVGVIDNATERPKLVSSGLLSIEPGMWGNVEAPHLGSPTIGEIRMHMRDTSVENNLLQDVEFDDDEILSALRRPIQYWNEQPPSLPFATFNCRTFPFRYNWLNATVGELLLTAAHHYARNDLAINQGGLSVADKAKHQLYLAMSEKYMAEWKDFVAYKKVELNLARAYGGVTSTYGRPYTW